MEITQQKFDELIERAGKMQKSGAVDLWTVGDIVNKLVDYCGE